MVKEQHWLLIKGAVSDSGESLGMFEVNSQSNTHHLSEAPPLNSWSCIAKAGTRTIKAPCHLTPPLVTSVAGIHPLFLIGWNSVASLCLFFIYRVRRPPDFLSAHTQDGQLTHREEMFAEFDQTAHWVWIAYRTFNSYCNQNKCCGISTSYADLYQHTCSL